MLHHGKEVPPEARSLLASHRLTTFLDLDDTRPPSANRLVPDTPRGISRGEGRPAASEWAGRPASHPKCPVELRTTDDVLVCGVQKGPLSPSTYRVVAALAAAYPARLTGPQLAERSHTGDPGNAVRRLIYPESKAGQADREWAAVLSLPSHRGRTRGTGAEGYGIRAPSPE
jgi:hypothetical protein